MGGRVTAAVESESCTDSATRTQSVEGKMCAGIDTKVKAGSVCPEGSQSETTSETSATTSDGWDVVVEGGDRNTCQKTDCDFDAFAETIDSTRLELIEAELEPITTYIKMLAASNDVIEFRRTGSTAMFSAPHLQGLEEGIAAYLTNSVQSDIDATQVCNEVDAAKCGAPLMLVAVASMLFAHM